VGVHTKDAWQCRAYGKSGVDSELTSEGSGCTQQKWVIIPSLIESALCNWNMPKRAWKNEKIAKIQRQSCTVAGSSIMYITGTFTRMSCTTAYSRGKKHNKVPVAMATVA
jgi:hypothetical protein